MVFVSFVDLDVSSADPRTQSSEQSKRNSFKLKLRGIISKQQLLLIHFFDFGAWRHANELRQMICAVVNKSSITL